PAVEQSDERVGLRRFELHVIAVEIEALRVFARPDSADRAVLRGAGVQAELLIAVGVVNWGDQNDQAAEQRLQIAARNAPGEMKYRLFDLGFAGMNSSLNEDDRFAGSFRLQRPRDGRIGEDHQRQIAAFFGFAEGFDAQFVRAFL